MAFLQYTGIRAFSQKKAGNVTQNFLLQYHEQFCLQISSTLTRTICFDTI